MNTNKNTMYDSIELVSLIRKSGFHSGIKSFLINSVLTANKIQATIDHLYHDKWSQGDLNAEKDRIVDNFNNDFYGAFEKHK